MTEVDLLFKTLRVNLRRHGKTIADDVVRRHHPIGVDSKNEICIFCNSSSNITKEHVLPKWVVGDELLNTMTSSVNKQQVIYNRAVVPACSQCNNSILAFIENYIIKIVHYMETANDCSNEHIHNIIRWLEILDYKFQVLDCRRKYIKYGNLEYDRDWGIIPVSMMRHFFNMRPWKGYDWLRVSQRRITVKRRSENINSFVIIKPRLPHFYFFHQPNQYIYISFPMCRVAFFYFFKKSFEFYEHAGAEALDIIKKVTESD
jgi:hypothetical protein